MTRAWKKDRIRLRRRLIRLWHDDPTCYWCGNSTVLIISQEGFPGFPRRATIDHLNSRLSGKRNCNGSVPQTVLACYACNQHRANKEVAALRVARLENKANTIRSR